MIMRIRLPLWTVAACITVFAAGHVAAHPVAVGEVPVNPDAQYHHADPAPSGADFQPAWTEHRYKHDWHHDAYRQPEACVWHEASPQGWQGWQGQSDNMCAVQPILLDDLAARYPHGIGPVMLVPVMVAIPQRAVIREYVTEEWIEE